VLLQQSVVLLLLHDHVSLVLLEFLLQEVDQVIVTSSILGHQIVCGTPIVIRLLHALIPLRKINRLIVLAILHVSHSCGILKLLLQTLDDFLTEM